MIIIIRSDSTEELRKIIKVASYLGYKYILFEKNIDTNKEFIKNLIDEIDYKSCLIPIEFLGRKKYNNNRGFLLVAYADSKENLMKYLRMSNISLIITDVRNISSLLDRKTINVMEQYHKYLMVDFKPLFDITHGEKIKLVKQIKRKALYYLNKTKPKYIYAMQIQNMYDLVSPRQLRSLLLILGIKDYIIKKNMKENPHELILAPKEVNIIDDFHELILKLCSSFCGE